MDSDHEESVVIVGGGICGLATALALHRNGIKSVVLERSDTLRATGAAIIMHVNGWRALEQLGVASSLRQNAVAVESGRFISLENGQEDEIAIGVGEFRCLKRTDLIETMADELPPDTVKFGCHVLSVKLDPLTSYPVLHLQNGNVLKTKVVIGCDGVNSVVANFVGLRSTKRSSMCVVRGFTSYEDGHGFEDQFVVLKKGKVQLGRMPITDKIVYWFVTRIWTSQDSIISKDPTLIRQSTMEHLTGFPAKGLEMVLGSDQTTLSLTDLKYRAPWDLLPGRGNFLKGTVAVAGDAMHAMAPFLAQGGAASLEDAIVLSRCLAKARADGRRASLIDALDEYVRLRRGRVVRLSTQTFLVGLMLSSSSAVLKFVIVILMVILFGDKAGHTRYDCGRLST